MTAWLWIAFLGLIGALVALDLGVLTRRPRQVSRADALASIALWALAALAFSFVLGYVFQTTLFRLQSQISFPTDRVPITGNAAWLQFITAYTLELALSLDNIAVLALLIRYFKVPGPLVPRLLFWSILFSLTARWIAISVFGRLLGEYSWMSAVLGGVLLLAMLRMLVMPTERTDFSKRFSVRLASRIAPIGPLPPGQSLFARAGDGRGWAATPMLPVVLAACALDLTYAADSIPALFAVTKEPFIAFSASAFAVLGLRALYFALAEAVAKFRFLRLALVAILCFIALQMLERSYITRATEFTLAFVAGVMLVAYGASALWNRLQPAPTRPAPATPLEDLSEAIVATRRNLRKVVILIVGTFIIVCGIIIAPLPGPGPTILVPIGLALLATEFIWARRLLDRLKTGVFDLSGRADAIVDRTSVWVIPAAIIAYWALSLGVLIGLLGLRWQLVAVFAGSPFMPLAIWAYRYLKRFWGRSANRSTDSRPASDADQTTTIDSNSARAPASPTGPRSPAT